MTKPPPIILMSDTAQGGAAAGTARLLAGLESLHPGLAEWWHFSPSSPLTQGIPSCSLDPRRKRPPFERAIKNVSLSFANRLRRARHRKTFREAMEKRVPGLLNCHNIHSCGLNHDDLLLLPRALPLVWTMHDCWSFRPRAFEWHNRSEDRVEFLCEDSPIPAALDRRRRFFAARPDVVLVAPSKWIAAEARKALGDGVRIEHIPYGISGETFRPGDSSAVRARLNLNPDKIWLGIAATHAYSRKGLDVLSRALDLIDVSCLGLLSWGQKPELAFPAGLEVRMIGSVSDQDRIAELYAACDLFVCPSRSDNLPNTVLESFACGVPVIGSDAGGIPDMVRPGETGWIFPTDHPAACAAVLADAVAERNAWPAMKARCRQVAIQEYSPELQARRYADLFTELLGEVPSRS